MSIEGVELEELCPLCGGTGLGKGVYALYGCHECNGAGYVPTVFGEKILELIRHNFPTMLKDATDDGKSN